MLKRLALLGLLTLASPAWAGFMAGPAPEIPGDVVLPVSTTPVGAVAVDSFSGWTNPADTAANSTNWTSPSTSIRYLFQVDERYSVATTVDSWRDVEVTTWVRNGCVLLRYLDGTAVYFIHNGETTNGSFSVGVARGIVEGGTKTTQCPSWTSTLGLYSNSDLVGTVSGYSRTDTAGDTFTLGCAGWECYAEFNGVEFWRSSADIRLPIEAGKVALSTGTGYGFRDTTVAWLPLATINSRPAGQIYAMSDFGLYSVETTGSITSGSDELTVASSAGYEVGDDIIVACGFEAGACARNTVGVGDVWPEVHYADDAAMDAAVPCTANTYAYLEDSGKVRRCASNGASWNAWASTSYYENMKTPRALSATITAISGNTLTLDTTASATATNAAVYRDSSDYTAMFSDGRGNSSFMPFGTYLFPRNTVWTGARTFYLRNETNGQSAVVQGVGLNKTTPEYTLYSPDGSPGASLQLYESDGATVKNFFIRGNGGLEKYGLGWTATSASYPYGIRITLSNDVLVEDSGARNTLAAAVGGQYCTRCTFDVVYAKVTYAPALYIGDWKINQADSTDGVIRDAEVDSDWLINGFEIFRSSGVDIIRAVGRNALMSSNSSGGDWLIDAPYLTFTEDSADYPLYYGALDYFVISVNSNIQPPNPDMEEGGTIRNPTLLIEYLNPANELPTGIVINANNPNITVEGTYPSCSSPKGLIQTPGWYTGTNTFRGIGVGASGDGTVITGLRFVGAADYAGGKSNVYSQAGTGKTITVTDNVMDSSVLGTGTITETGTISNSTYEGLCP